MTYKFQSVDESKVEKRNSAFVRAGEGASELEVYFPPLTLGVWGDFTWNLLPVPPWWHFLVV
jgi:hypothetical protein